MNLQSIKRMQKEYGYSEMQNAINDGSIWKFEGSAGREAMCLLESGVCMLPKKVTYDYYGNTLPNRDFLKKGTKGTYQNSLNFWKRVESGEVCIF